MKKKFITILALLMILVPIGGYFYYFKLRPGETKKEEKILYTCPMHPQIISDKPGKCPICGMDLVPIEQVGVKDGRKEEDLTTIYVPEKTAAMLGLTFDKVEIRELSKEIIGPTLISFDETRVFKLTPKVNGWIEELFVNQTGQYVNKGDPVAKIFSPELYAAKAEYLSALNGERKLADTKDEQLKKTVQELKNAARERLKFFDLSDSEINQLEQEKEIKKTVTFYAPFSGYLLEKLVNKGSRVMMNEPMMTIADLSLLWGEVEIFQIDMPQIKAGMPVNIMIPNYPLSFNGKVSFVNPIINPETRRGKARVEIENKGLQLKPNMYADAVLRLSVGRKLSVSEDAVYRTGTKEYVFVKDNDHLKPVIVKTGFKSSDGYYEVVEGLKKGDIVVSSASFLIDSESRLKAVFQSIQAKE